MQPASSSQRATQQPASQQQPARADQAHPGPDRLAAPEPLDSSSHPKVREDCAVRPSTQRTDGSARTVADAVKWRGCSCARLRQTGAAGDVSAMLLATATPPGARAVSDGCSGGGGGWRRRRTVEKLLDKPPHVALGAAPEHPGDLWPCAMPSACRRAAPTATRGTPQARAENGTIT